MILINSFLQVRLIVYLGKTTDLLHHLSCIMKFEQVRVHVTTFFFPQINIASSIKNEILLEISQSPQNYLKENHC